MAPRVALIAVAVLLVAAGGSSARDSSSQTTITAGYQHSCAILAGAAQCWGDNVFGQLGDGTEKEERSRPFGVSGLGSGVLAISAGTFHTCAVTGVGAVECWGDDEDGQLGDGKKTSRSTPAVVAGLASGAQSVAAGDDFTCALLVGGSVKCWGDNDEGQLGDGTTTDHLRPVTVSGLPADVEAITAGRAHVCALIGTGGVECWGYNKYGQLGDGTRTRRSHPAVVSGLSSGVEAITAGAEHTCALLGNGVKCWGENDDGELGDGTKTHRSTPVSVSGLSTGVQSIGAGSVGYHTCAVLAAGDLSCWGDNDHGQLGDGTTVNRSTPIAVSSLPSGVLASAAGDFHTCALLSAGGFRCFGRNNTGQLGNGTFDRVLTVEVKGRGKVVGPRGFRCSKDCEIERLQGSRFTIKAQPAKGWKFKSWVYRAGFGSCKGRAPRCKVVLDANYFATARFVKRR